MGERDLLRILLAWKAGISWLHRARLQTATLKSQSSQQAYTSQLWVCLGFEGDGKAKPDLCSCCAPAAACLHINKYKPFSSRSCDLIPRKLVAYVSSNSAMVT